MKKIFFISAVSGIGKSTTCNYIRDNKLLENYVIFNIDELENIKKRYGEDSIQYINSFKIINELKGDNYE